MEALQGLSIGVSSHLFSRVWGVADLGNSWGSFTSPFLKAWFFWSKQSVSVLTSPAPSDLDTDQKPIHLAGGVLSPEERSGLELVFRIRAFMLSHNALDSAPLNGLSAHTSSPLVLALASHTCPTCSESLQGLLGPLCVFCSCQVVSDSVTLRTVPHQVPLSMGFPRQEYWSGLPFPLLGDLPHPGTESTSALQVDFWLLSHQGSPLGM